MGVVKITERSVRSLIVSLDELVRFATLQQRSLISKYLEWGTKQGVLTKKQIAVLRKIRTQLLEAAIFTKEIT